MTPPRSTSIHILAAVCSPSTGSSSIPQLAAEVPIGPANATERGASTAVTPWERSRVDPNSPFARWSTRAPRSSGAPPRTRHSRTPGAHSGQRPTSQRYAQTSGTLPAIVTRLSVLNAIARPLCRLLADAHGRRYRLAQNSAPCGPQDHAAVLALGAGAGRISPVADRDRRDTSLDLNPEETRALLDGVAALTERELATARSAPVFERPPSAAEIDRVIGAQRGLPAEGESVDDLLAACAAVLAAGRRTTPAFFGYVQSPPAPVAAAADLLASAADQNVTSWRSGPAAAAVERQTLRWLGEFVGFDAAATGILVGGGSAANLTALLIAMRAVTS